MFKKLFSKIDSVIEKFNEITNLEQIAIEVLQLIETAFSINISDDIEQSENFFDETMQGLLEAVAILTA